MAKNSTMETARKMIGRHLFFLRMFGNSSIMATKLVSTMENCTKHVEQKIDRKYKIPSRVLQILVCFEILSQRGQLLEAASILFCLCCVPVLMLSNEVFEGLKSSI